MRNKKRIITTVGLLALVTVVGALLFYVITEVFGKNEPEPTTVLEEVPIEIQVSSNEEEEEIEAVSGQEEDVSENELETVSENEPEVVEEPPAPVEEAPKEEPVAEPVQETYQDTQAPIFLTFSGSPQVKVGTEFDIHKYVGYADDVDRQVDITINGTVDTSVVGTYPINIVLTDDVGHVTAKDMTVYVVTDIVSAPPVTIPETFADFMANYKNENTAVGIDVSRWQNEIDFSRVAAAGCEFAYIRLGGYDDGELYTDKYFYQNFQNAKNAGLKVGIYWHAEESTPEEVRASVNYLMAVLGGQGVDFPIVYDWEDFKNFERYGMNLYDLNACFDNFEAEVEKFGYTACLYSSKNYMINAWITAKKRPIWLAHYTSATNYQGSYFMWQQSCWGSIDGIAGDVDFDVLYK